MDYSNPLMRSKIEYQETIGTIRSDNAAVGIDAQYTHAIIIEFLKQISDRLERLERAMEKSDFLEKGN